MIFDFHTHMHQGGLEPYINKKIPCIVNCMTLEEVRLALALRAQYPFIRVSIGCHPNHPELLDGLLPYYEKADFIGEIGLDCVWSQADLNLQRQAFVKSLDFAQKHKKTVILHTKGMEQEIAEIIRAYDLTFIVHWYSGDRAALDLLKEMDTYFTIGPDVHENKKVQNVIDTMDVSRILVETDGVEAIRWIGSDLDVSGTLESTIEYICQYKDVEKNEFCKILSQTFDQLMK